MRMARDVSAQDLIKLLKPYGYIVTRQTGSHIRLSTDQNGQHHITVPNHKSIKIGTLFSIITDIANHFKKTKDELIKEIFA